MVYIQFFRLFKNFVLCHWSLANQLHWSLVIILYVIPAKSNSLSNMSHVVAFKRHFQHSVWSQTQGSSPFQLFLQYSKWAQLTKELRRKLHIVTYMHTIVSWRSVPEYVRTYLLSIYIKPNCSLVHKVPTRKFLYSTFLRNVKKYCLCHWSLGWRLLSLYRALWQYLHVITGPTANTNSLSVK